MIAITIGQTTKVPLAKIKPSPKNDTLYKPVDQTAPSFQKLVQSVRKHGILEPLTLTLDDVILSGHRRHAAAECVGLEHVPCRYVEVYSDAENFVELLRQHNNQRVKTIDEQLREQIVDADPEEAYQALLRHREAAARVSLQPLAIEGAMKRSPISAAKQPMVEAVKRVLDARRNFWPVSVRSIHYALLNEPPLIHKSKPDSTYRNDQSSYKSLCDITMRMRLEAMIPMHAIGDTTRPISIWDIHAAPADFVARELEGFLKGYRRNLQQSQPHHIEIMGEKNTIGSTLEPVAGRYGIPLTIGRGFSSLEPRFEMGERFKHSGKDKLFLLVLTDFDPSGEEICHSFARSLRDDLGIQKVQLVKVALTNDHVVRFNLPPQMQAKKSDSRAKKFTEKHGSDVWELEALPPETLQQELTRAIDSVMNLELFNRELDKEKQDAAYLDGYRRRARQALQQSS